LMHSGAHQTPVIMRLSIASPAALPWRLVGSPLPDLLRQHVIDAHASAGAESLGQALDDVQRPDESKRGRLALARVHVRREPAPVPTEHVRMGPSQQFRQRCQVHNRLPRGVAAAVSRAVRRSPRPRTPRGSAAQRAGSAKPEPEWPPPGGASAIRPARLRPDPAASSHRSDAPRSRTRQQVTCYLRHVRVPAGGEPQCG